MGKPRSPDHVKLFMGILYRSESVYKRAELILEEEFGNVDTRDIGREFSHTDYYQKEMGTP